jgi:hypothetical protein
MRFWRTRSARCDDVAALGHVVPLSRERERGEVSGNGRPNRIVGRPNADVLDGSGGGDTLVGGGGADVPIGGDGIDSFEALDGHIDNLQGGIP